MPTFGLTPTGFRLPRQSEILAALQQSFQSQFGATVNLSDETVFGQLITILSEREALWWEGLEADVLSATPAGAQGVYVDNILAYSGLTRLPAKATVTDPTPTTESDGKVRYGLVCYGDQGTVISKGALIQTVTQPTYSFALDNQVTIGAGQSAVQAIFFNSTPTSGTYALGLQTPAGEQVVTSPLPVGTLAQVTQVTYNATPTAGTLTLSFAGQTTRAIAYSASAADVQAAIQALMGFAGVGVTGSMAQGYFISWPGGAIPLVTATSTGTPVTVLQPVQARINALVDPSTGKTPFADVMVTQPSQTQLLITFGANAAPKDQPSSANMAQGRIVIAQNSLMAGNKPCSLAVIARAMGNPAQAVAQATCTQTGPYAVPAGTLTVIGSSQQGWSGVTNQLDCLTGRDVETDMQAIDRRSGQLASKGNGPLASVVEKVQQVPGVTAAIGFNNLSGAAQQMLTFATMPTGGQFTLAYGASMTPAQAYNVSASALQQALSALPGLASVRVSGSYTYGYTIDFGGAFGGQATQLLTIAQDTTGAQLTAAYGRPPKSIEIVVEGGDDVAVAQAILLSAPAGIATYGSPVLQTSGSCTAGSAQMALAAIGQAEVGDAIFAQGLRPGSVIAAISGTTVTLSLPALSTASNVAVTVNHTIFVRDSAGNVQQVAFSRPQSILVYVDCQLVTDFYNVPGDPTSGANTAALFDPASLATVQADLIANGNAVGIGGTLIAKGTNSLQSCFREVPGVLDFSLAFDTVTPPVNTGNLTFLSEQAPLLSTFSTGVSFT